MTKEITTIKELVDYAKTRNFTIKLNIYNKPITTHCDGCQAQAEKVLPGVDVKKVRWVKLDNAFVFTHNATGRVYNRCLCGHGCFPEKKKDPKTKTVAPKAPVMCKQCGKNPLPPDRKAKCYECHAPSKKAKAQVKEPIQEAALSQGKAIY